MEIASRYGPLVGLITSSDGSIGSGALISDDGLLLTAAHVVSSERLSVRFTHSSDATTYGADIVFLDATHDVALLKLSHYHAERWFELALDEPAAQGEPVAAIGHPYIGSASDTDSTVSIGIVARSSRSSDKLTSAELIADIAVASGSSGGPLISRRTGKLVGVVTAVISPSISKDFATSGYWAVAAPAKELGRWLGLGYAP